MSKFVKLWMGSCFFYMVDIFILFLLFSGMLSSEAAQSSLPILFDIISVYAIMFVFSACCAIDNIPIKKFWDRYILLLIVYSIVLRLSNIEQLIISLPFYLYQMILICGILSVIFSKWRFSLGIKLWSAFTIFTTCMMQIYCSLNIVFKEFNFLVLYLDVCMLFTP